jgi:hypothetical protein
LIKKRLVELASPSPNLLINVKTRLGKVFPLSVNVGDSIRTVESKIEEKEGSLIIHRN